MLTYPFTSKADIQCMLVHCWSASVDQSQVYWGRAGQSLGKGSVLVTILGMDITRHIYIE